MTPNERVVRIIDPASPPAPPVPLARRAAPWALSLGAHTAFVALAFFIAWTVTPVDRPAPAVVSFDAPAFAPAPEVAPAPAPDAPAFLPEEALPTLPDLPDAGAPLALGDAFADAPTLPTIDAPPPPAPIGAGAREVTFAGVGASDARDIVYVVDFSGAMITAFPDIVRELKRSAGALHPTQRFQVVVLRGGAEQRVEHAPFPAGLARPILIDATYDAREAVFAWLDALRPRGGTNLLAALEAALALRPDAVFVLGRFSKADLLDASVEDILARLERLNPADADGDRPVAIKTIQILSEDETGLMRAIGGAHGGESGYKFVTLDELMRETPGAAPPRLDPGR